jgi:putative Holliday junction resolvase
MKILAIDFGEKRLGMAVGDSETRTAAPIDPLFRSTIPHDLSRLASVIEEYEIKKIVLGMPLNMDGSEGEIARLVKEFAVLLKKALSLPLEFVDERLSSFEAEQALAPLALDRRKKKGKIDSVAAWILIREYLEIG